MKLWLLQPRNLPKDEAKNPWEPWYDKTLGFVVRAETEQDARQIADENGMEENRGGKHPWLDAALSTCEELTADGEPGMILEDHAGA